MVSDGNHTWSHFFFLPCCPDFLLLRPSVLSISLPRGPVTDLSRGSTSLADCCWHIGFFRWQLCIRMSEPHQIPGRSEKKKYLSRNFESHNKAGIFVLFYRILPWQLFLFLFVTFPPWFFLCILSSLPSLLSPQTWKKFIGVEGREQRRCCGQIQVKSLNSESCPSPITTVIRLHYVSDAFSP